VKSLLTQTHSYIRQCSIVLLLTLVAASPPSRKTIRMKEVKASISVPALSGSRSVIQPSTTDCGSIGVTGTQRGIAIGLYDHAEELFGIQIGLLNRADNNPGLFRILPFLNAHF